MLYIIDGKIVYAECHLVGVDIDIKTDAYDYRITATNNDGVYVTQYFTYSVHSLDVITGKTKTQKPDYVVLDSFYDAERSIHPTVYIRKIGKNKVFDAASEQYDVAFLDKNGKIIISSNDSDMVSASVPLKNKNGQLVGYYGETASGCYIFDNNGKVPSLSLKICVSNKRTRTILF